MDDSAGYALDAVKLEGAEENDEEAGKEEEEGEDDDMDNEITQAESNKCSVRRVERSVMTVSKDDGEEEEDRLPTKGGFEIMIMYL